MRYRGVGRVLDRVPKKSKFAEWPAEFSVYSMDFLSEISKFQKIHLNKVFAFFNLSSKHTLLLVVQAPNSQKFKVA